MEKASSKTGKEKEKMMEDFVLSQVSEQRPYKICAALSFALIMLIVGIPLWWKTTEVYRAYVPYSDIYTLGKTPITVPVSLKLVWFSGLDSGLVRETEIALETLLKSRSSFGKLRFDFKFSSKEANTEEMTIVNSANGLSDWAEAIRMKELEENLTLSLYILPQSFPVVGNTTKFYLGSAADGFIIGQDEAESIVKIIEIAIFEIYLNIDRLETIVRRNFEDNEPYKGKYDTKNFGSLHPIFSLDYYLINPNPDKCDTRSMDFEKLTETTLKPIYSKLQLITNITVKSQSLYYVDLPTKPTFDESQSAFILESNHLPHLISPMEKYVTSLEPKHPVFHILVYVVPPETYPLIILDDKGAPALYNSFVISGWGGFVVYNPPKVCDGKMGMFDRELTEGLISLLRALFGLTAGTSLPSGFLRHQSPIAQWEVHRLMMEACLENLLSAAKTLQSLTKLLDEIKNIVIHDDVAIEIESAVQSWKLAILALENRSVSSALDYSKQAVIRAEKAFFDPSLLALLYFPDDQKYAIYVPLFLPVGVPVLFSLRFVIKYFKEKRKAKLE